MSTLVNKIWGIAIFGWMFVGLNSAVAQEQRSIEGVWKIDRIIRENELEISQ
jgi:hypothetical protein